MSAESKEYHLANFPEVQHMEADSILGCTPLAVADEN